MAADGNSRSSEHCDLYLEGPGFPPLFALTGALSAIEIAGYGVASVAGSSGGAIIAALLAARYSAPEIWTMLQNVQLSGLLDSSPKRRPIEASRLEAGVHNGDALVAWLNDLLAQRDIQTFGDLRRSGADDARYQYRLAVVSFDADSRRPFILPRDASLHGIDPDTVKVADAVRAAIALPFFFTPVKLGSADLGFVTLVDGTVDPGFPIGMFDSDTIPPWPTFGCRVKLASGLDGEMDQRAGEIAQPSVLQHLQEAVAVRAALDECDSARTIQVDLTDGFTPTMANLSKQAMQELYLRGRREAERFVTAWDFEDHLRRCRKGNSAGGSERTARSDAVPTWLDRPTSADRLQRTEFSLLLAESIRQARKTDEEGRSFMAHLDGAWGSGKSSVLLLLRDELRRSPPWVVVEINAWERQRIDPPWWALMDSVFRQSLEQVVNWRKAVLIWLKEMWWRFRKGGAAYLLAALVLAAASVALWLGYRRAHGVSLGQIIGTVGTVLSVGATAWAAAIALSRTMFLGSGRSARGFQESAHDPMDTVRSHFKKMVGWFRPQEIAILIDDLDRCRAEYVVSFLEGIQTLFSDVPISYIVAADGRWLYASFETIYSSFREGIIHESGRPLGSLFLEKAFQLSARVPGMSPALQREYWEFLLANQPAVKNQNLNHRVEMADRLFAQTKDEEDILQVVKTETEGAPSDSSRSLAIRAAAVRRIASETIQAGMQHRLAQFAPLLEPNPRAMIRFINAYGLERGTLLLERAIISREHLAQLVILEQRWPQLLECLSQHPEAIDDIGSGSIDRLCPGLESLLHDPTVLEVIKGNAGGEQIGTPLTPEAITIFARTRRRILSPDRSSKV